MWRVRKRVGKIGRWLLCEWAVRTGGGATRLSVSIRKGVDYLTHPILVLIENCIMRLRRLDKEGGREGGSETGSEGRREGEVTSHEGEMISHEPLHE